MIEHAAHREEPTFCIGDVPIYGDAILAPLSGYTDLPFRVICREMGSAMSYTPCITDVAVVYGSSRTEQLAEFADVERPVAVQLLSADEDDLIRAAAQLMAQQPDIIDLNMGCPARRIVGAGRGAALMRDPQRIGRMIRALVEAVPVPVTGKIRLGWDAATRNHVEVAHVLEDNGALAIAVHGRTRAQQYSGEADWEAIADVRRAVKVPVIANGDVRTPEDIARIKAATGCQAAMIGRGAIGNPWIFAQRDIHEVGYAERLAVVRRHALWMADYYDEPLGVVLFRKHVVKYVQGMPHATEVRPKLLAAETVGQLLSVLDDWMSQRLER